MLNQWLARVAARRGLSARLSVAQKQAADEQPERERAADPDDNPGEQMPCHADDSMQGQSSSPRSCATSRHLAAVRITPPGGPPPGPPFCLRTVGRARRERTGAARFGARRMRRVAARDLSAQKKAARIRGR